MASSSRRSTRVVTVVDAATAADTIDQARGLARGLRRSTPVAKAIVPPPARLGACYFPSRASLACMCLFGVCGIYLVNVEMILVAGLQFFRAPLLELVETILFHWVSVLQASNIA